MPSYYSKELSGTQSESSPISHPTEKGQEVRSSHEMSETAVCVTARPGARGPLPGTTEEGREGGMETRDTERGQSAQSLSDLLFSLEALLRAGPALEKAPLKAERKGMGGRPQAWSGLPGLLSSSLCYPVGGSRCLI